LISIVRARNLSGAASPILHPERLDEGALWDLDAAEFAQALPSFCLSRSLRLHGKRCFEALVEEGGCAG
jgi:hypothetical protein